MAEICPETAGQYPRAPEKQQEALGRGPPHYLGPGPARLCNTSLRSQLARALGSPSPISPVTAGPVGSVSTGRQKRPAGREAQRLKSTGRPGLPLTSLWTPSHSGQQEADGPALGTPKYL